MHVPDLWHKTAIFYCLDVETYMDGNNDGVGDFRGLRLRLDEIASLGVNCIWLLPFYPSPNRDNGYDIMDYYGVDPRLGNLGDFVDFIHHAKEYGIRVIIDLVVNHTSMDHPWFQKAVEDPHSKYYHYYVWSQEKPESNAPLVFPGQQESIWTYHEQAGAWYLHRFYAHQPDLNIANPEVQEEIRKIMGFWLQLGVSGFRIDAAPYLIELRGVDAPQHQDPYTYLTSLRTFLSWRHGDAIILGEVNVPNDQLPHYFGDGNRMHMLFDFTLCQNIYLALAQGRAAPIRESLQSLPKTPLASQWAIFLRNHDELNLGKLSDEAKQRVYETFAPEENMQIFGRGIRRRIAPMVGNDRRKLELLHSLMLTMNGSPVLRYGQEIGMGDDLSLPGRNSVRTPMQWSDEINGGFSRAPRVSSCAR
ncbi:MAG: trehalose synthase [Anaerolineae bacterium]|nr:trehalose synthase [Anaerolineae bacterium]